MTSQNSNPSPQPKNLFHPALWSFAGNEEVRLRSRKSKRAHPKTAPCTAQRSKRCIMRARTPRGVPQARLFADPFALGVLCFRAAAASRAAPSLSVVLDFEIDGNSSLLRLHRCRQPDHALFSQSPRGQPHQPANRQAGLLSELLRPLSAIVTGP